MYPSLRPASRSSSQTLRARGQPLRLSRSPKLASGWSGRSQNVRRSPTRTAPSPRSNAIWAPIIRSPSTARATPRRRFPQWSCKSSATTRRHISAKRSPRRSSPSRHTSRMHSVRRPRTRARSLGWMSNASSTSRPLPRSHTVLTRKRIRRSWSTTSAAVPSMFRSLRWATVYRRFSRPTATPVWAATTLTSGSSTTSRTSSSGKTASTCATIRWLCSA